MNDFAMHVRQPSLDAVVVVRQPCVVDAEEVQDRGVEVVPVTGLSTDFQPTSSVLRRRDPCFRPPPAIQTRSRTCCDRVRRQRCLLLTA